MLKKIALFIVLFAGLSLGKDVSKDNINYNKLDPAYYKYIKLYNKTSDKEVAKLIRDLNEGSKKTGLFLGASLGSLANDITSNLPEAYLFAYGLKFGYQTFLPSFFEKIFLPNYVGRRIYIQYLGSNFKEDELGKFSFSYIGVNGDILIDFSSSKYFSAGVIAGIGLGSMVHGHNANAVFSAMANMGLGLTILSHNRLEFELKLVTDKDMEWLGSLFMVGYQYVF